MVDIGIALLGLGRAGSFHLTSIATLPGVRLRQVYDIDQDRAARVAADTGSVAADDAVAAIGAPNVDAVVVATPTLSHHDYVTAALGEGKPVLSEKPLGTELAHIDRCYDTAARAGVPLLVAFQRRFDPSFAAAVTAAHRGEVGELQFIRSVSRDNPVPSIDYIRTSCGIFHDCVVHDLDMVCLLAPSPPAEVFAMASSFIDDIAAVGDVDNVVISLRFASGLLATIDVNRRSVYGYDQRLEVFGDGGMLQVGNRPQSTLSQETVIGAASAPIDYSFPTRYADAYRSEFECFLACVRDERDVPVTHDQVRLVHRLADAAEQSARERVAVVVDDDPV